MAPAGHFSLASWLHVFVSISISVRHTLSPSLSSVYASTNPQSTARRGCLAMRQRLLLGLLLWLLLVCILACAQHAAAAIAAAAPAACCSGGCAQAVHLLLCCLNDQVLVWLQRLIAVAGHILPIRVSDLCVGVCCCVCQAGRQANR